MTAGSARTLRRGARRSDAICFTSVAASRPLRILYAAIDQTVPGTLGGSVHVRAVAEGLAAVGNEVHALVTRGGARGPRARCGGARSRHPAGVRSSGCWPLARSRGSTRPSSRTWSSSAITTSAARACWRRAPSARSTCSKSTRRSSTTPARPSRALDRALVVQPMRRWRERLVRAADLIVSPSTQILPTGCRPTGCSRSSGAPTPCASTRRPAAMSCGTGSREA